jgi:hypothetical protein
MASLSTTTLNDLRAAATAGNAAAYYNILIQNNVAYGSLALGAATNGNSGNYWADFGGRFANNFLEQRYKERTGLDLTSAQQQQVRENLIRADLALRESGEVTAAGIKDYHHQVFADLGIPPDAWTGTFFDARSNAESWCWGCGTEELGGQGGESGIGDRAVNSMGDFFSSLFNDFSGTSAELSEFVQSVAGDNFGGGVLSKTMADMNFDATGSPAWAAVVAALTQAPVMAASGWAKIFDAVSDLFDGDSAKVSPDVGKNFTGAQNWVPRRDPLTLDLDGDGLETSGTSSTRPIYFDHDGDGIRSSTGWVLPDDGFLVLDRNGNGAIDNGRELFGDATVLASGQQAANGFAALRDLDTNGDGSIDAGDTQWSQLRVWRDANQDGISQQSELATLGEVGIKAIGVTEKLHSQILSNRNEIANLGEFTRIDGTLGTLGEVGHMADINLAEDTFYSRFTTAIPLRADVLSLPAMSGSGQVRDLQEAASIDSAAGTALRAQLAQFAAATTRAQQLALVDGLIQAWAASSNMPTSITVNRTPSWYHSWTGNIAPPADFQPSSAVTAIEQFAADYPELYAQVTALEKFNGRILLGRFVVQTSASNVDARDGTYQVSFSTEQAGLLRAAWEALRSSVYTSMAVQTRLADLDSLYRFAIDGSGELKMDLSGLSARFATQAVADPVHAIEDLADFNVAMGKSLPEWDGWELFSDLVQAAPQSAALASAMESLGMIAPGKLSYTLPVTSAGSDRVVGGSANDTINAGAGDDIVLGMAGNDVLSADAGNDRLHGGAGDDTLMGGAGNDILVGGTGNDTLYGYNSGGYTDGASGSEIYRFAKGDGVDTIVEDTYPANDNDVIELTDAGVADVRSVERSGADLVLKYGAADQITVRGYFNGARYQVEQIKFSDGAVWNGATIAAQALVKGTAGADSLTGAIYTDAVRMFGFDGNDSLTGGSYADALDGGAGDDVLMGGAGNDVLIGGTGNDTLYGYNSGGYTDGA